MEGLRTCEGEINKLLNTPNSEAKTIHNLFKNMVLKTIEKSNLKKKKVLNRKDPQWFDHECKKAKNEIRSKGKSLQKKTQRFRTKKVLIQRKT